MAGVDDGVIRQREEPSPDRVDDQVGVREGPACRARPTLEQGVAGEHDTQVGCVQAHRSGRVPRGVQHRQRGIPDRDLLADLYRAWAQEGQIPAVMSAVDDVANAMLSLIAVSRANPTVVSDIVHLSPRTVNSR